MTDGGSIHKTIPAIINGERRLIPFDLSGDSVEIGGATFSRENLLWALGVNQKMKDSPGNRA